MMRRTKGIPFIAALTVGVSAILVFMQQGQDLVRGVGEDDFWQYPSGLLQIAFALGLLFLAFQAWSWSRIIITSNYGADRAKWRPKQLLIWTPRVLGALPFAATAWALFKNPARNSWFVFALIAVGLLFFAFVIRRQDVAAPLRRRAARLGRARHFDLIQRYWVIFSFAAAAVLMAAAAIWPARFGALLGARRSSSSASASSFRSPSIGIQIGSALRIPVVGAMLLWAVVVGLWMDNHAIGRRAFAAATTGPIDRPTLKEAYQQWKASLPADKEGKRTMVLVAVQGGASRAGYWTAVALSNLREAAKAKGVDLDAHLFAISSVSGGSVGAVGYAAMLKSAPDAPDFKLRLLRFAGQDALGPRDVGHALSRSPAALPAGRVPARSRRGARAIVGGNLGVDRPAGAERRADARAVPQSCAEGGRAVAPDPHRPGRERGQRPALSYERRQIRLRRGRRRRSPRQHGP